MNFRVDIDNLQVKYMASQGKIKELLKEDQLLKNIK